MPKIPVVVIGSELGTRPSNSDFEVRTMADLRKYDLICAMFFHMELEELEKVAGEHNIEVI